MTAPRAVRAALAALALAGAGACGGGGEGAPPAAGAPPSGVTTSPFVARASEPPVALTWRIGVTENVSAAQMQAFYTLLVAANDAVWNVSEGQVRIHAVALRDAVAPGVTTSRFMDQPSLIDTSDLDVVVWPPQMWDIPAGGAVTAGGNIGRTNRLVVVPLNAAVFVLLHEASHMVWDLSWPLGPMLFDEYLDGVQDDACVMESQNLPLRWCSDANHVEQSAQPHACWHQILADYPSFTHHGSDAAPELPPAPEVTYEDR